MFQKVRKTLLKSLKILIIQICLRNTTVIFQCADSSNDYNSTWVKICHTALDIKEFLCTKVCTKTSLCNCIISKLHSHLGSRYRVTSMSDVCKRSTMNDCRHMLQSLNQVRLQGILQKCCHSTLCMKITSCYRFLL